MDAITRRKHALSAVRLAETVIAQHCLTIAETRQENRARFASVHRRILSQIAVVGRRILESFGTQEDFAQRLVARPNGARRV